MPLDGLAVLQIHLHKNIYGIRQYVYFQAISVHAAFCRVNLAPLDTITRTGGGGGGVGGDHHGVHITGSQPN